MEYFINKFIEQFKEEHNFSNLFIIFSMLTVSTVLITSITNKFFQFSLVYSFFVIYPIFLEKKLKIDFQYKFKHFIGTCIYFIASIAILIPTYEYMMTDNDFILLFIAILLQMFYSLFLTIKSLKSKKKIS